MTGAQPKSSNVLVDYATAVQLVSDTGFNSLDDICWIRVRVRVASNSRTLPGGVSRFYNLKRHNDTTRRV